MLLLQGDTHKYLADRPLRSGSPVHGVKTKAPTVTRIVVEGETASEWLRLRVRPRAKTLFSWRRMKVAGWTAHARTGDQRAAGASIGAQVIVQATTSTTSSPACSVQ